MTKYKQNKISIGSCLRIVSIKKILSYMRFWIMCIRKNFMKSYCIICIIAVDNAIEVNINRLIGIKTTNY